MDIRNNLHIKGKDGHERVVEYVDGDTVHWHSSTGQKGIATSEFSTPRKRVYTCSHEAFKKWAKGGTIIADGLGVPDATPVEPSQPTEPAVDAAPKRAPRPPGKPGDKARREAAKSGCARTPSVAECRRARRFLRA